MNKKELAKEIFNHPMMKVLRESKGVDNKVLIRILAEEINEQYLLDEAPKNTLSNKLTKMIADTFKELGERTSDPEALTAAVNDTVLRFINLMKNDISKLFQTWDTWSDERKQSMIDASKEYTPAIADRIKSALAKYAKDGQFSDTEAEKAAAVILEPIADELEADAEQQSPELTDDQTTEILNQFLDIVAQVLKGSPLQEQEVKDNEFGKFIMAFLEAAEVNPEQVKQIKTKLGEVELDLRVVDQALAAEGAIQQALEGLKQRQEEPAETETDASTVEQKYGEAIRAITTEQEYPVIIKFLAALTTNQILSEKTSIAQLSNQMGTDHKKMVKTIQQLAKEERKVVINFLRNEEKRGQFFEIVKGDLTNPPEGAVEDSDAEATPENEDLEELPKAELQRKMLAQSIEPVDKFFDDTDGFLKQLLLSDQGKLLRDMIVGLGKIERGDLGEDLALTDIIVVPDEPDPQPEQEPETKPDEGETASQQNEQIQEQEEPQVPANAKARRMVKNEVAAIRDLLKDVVAVAKRYEQNATRTNIDSRFDGTKLKVVFDEKLEATQRQIARLVAIIGKVMEEAMADKAGEQLQEQDVKTRQEKVKLVQDTYRDLRRLYKNSFQVQAGEKFDFAKSQQAARNMINIVDDSGIVAFYPRITNFDATTGQVITLGQAYEEMTKLVKKLAKTTADIFLNVRDGEVEVNNMQRAILDLQDISSAIENYYGIKSMIRAKDVAKIDPEQAQTFIGDGQREASPLIGTGQGKEIPAPPEQPPMSADVEIIDEPMERMEFYREYIKGDRYEELKNTGVSNQEIRTLVDFLRQLKFNYEQSQVNEKKGDGLRKIINFSKGQFSGDLFTDTLESMGAVGGSGIQRRLVSVLDKATDFTIELIEDMLGITLGTSHFKNPLGDKTKSSVPKDLEFDTGDDIYSTGQMGTGKPIDFSPDPSKRVPSRLPGGRKTFSGPTGYTGSSERTPARRLRGSRPPGGKKPKTPPRKRDARGRRMEEQLINKLIPIVESILKD